MNNLQIFQIKVYLKMTYQIKIYLKIILLNKTNKIKKIYNKQIYKVKNLYNLHKNPHNYTLLNKI